MKKCLPMSALLVVLSACFAILGQEQPTDLQLLTALDESRLFDTDVTDIRVRIESETPTESREAEIRLLFAELEGDAVSRIEFLSPEALAGQLYLNTPQGTYFYGPDLDFPIKTSATTEVFGDAAVAQTSGIRFALDYTIAERRATTSNDGTELLEIDLVAVDYGVAFQAATLAVDPSALRPISAVLYAVTGLPLYEVFYGPYETRPNGDEYVKTQRIENRLLVGRITVSEILDVSTQTHSLTLFDPAQLGDVE